ncbi:Clp protease N-terminal domain-containing protein [Leifsonia sp. SIMBA_070]|uniref:Clp protease N-terminal domain-containing protein n=1 Tax=Leifsonia sp. SIMBA_070 TaxID=3085810 RepID=UPI00397DFA57
MSETNAALPADPPGQPLSRALRPIIIRAVAEAQQRSSALVEAEHLLLALARDGAPQVRAALAGAGLDPDGLTAALAAERAASLRVAGVTPPPAERLAAAPRIARPRWGASAREALVRAHRVAAHGHRHSSGEVDLLIAVVNLDLGTVPRALTMAGVDRNALIAAVGRAA